MKGLGRAFRNFGAMMAGTAIASAGHAQTVPATQTAPVIVTGRTLPAAEAPKSATCEALSRDPHFRAVNAAAAALGVLGPTIYQPTRLPRNPDYRAPPSVPEGSALPVLTKTRFAVRDAVYGPSGEPTTPGSPPAGEAVAQADPGPAATAVTNLDQAVVACREVYRSGGVGYLVNAGREGLGANGAFVAANARFANGRAEIARNDKTLPMAFALFDQGRYHEALTWFRKAFQKLPYEDGGDEAALFVGKLYLQGLGEKSNTKEGVKWLKKAANAGFNPILHTPIFDPRQPARNTAIGEACVILGNVYRSGFEGIAKDPDQARDWYERAYAVGHIAAAQVLGDLYYKGVDTPRDVRKAAVYYQKAATFDLAAAQVALADILVTGEEGVPQDRERAFAWYRAAAMNDNDVALLALADAYARGEGVAADPVMAMGFYKTAAFKGNMAAKAALGRYFYEGKLLPKDGAVARRWFEEAAIGSDPEGMFNLAAMLANGEGGPKDMTKAWIWLRLAGALGHERAPVALTVVEARMTPAERDAARAVVRPKR
ncbi:tetratricopeptide repeat protein [Sphingomonas sp. CFBP 8760]|uniref:tetratricopeptide repeat protein n=1 Tax=Sphingomonas sp. CFBP 8760 TaxID=2775282 RepID=UPI00177E2AA2|nr:SEL1-like repeat protein [Sphingomonas sp. CFBP 8760]MBD8546752.1 sel1 repeat family protein [Sphingomonas sp. CFBP 8760]